MGDRIKNISAIIIIIIILLPILAVYIISPVYNELSKKDISYDYVIQDTLIKTIKESENGRIINEGINVGIIGRPNVGKSSLLNSLLEKQGG